MIDLWLNRFSGQDFTLDLFAPEYIFSHEERQTVSDLYDIALSSDL